MVGTLTCYAVLRRLYPGERFALWMLVGLYLFGPILCLTATTFSGGGFTQFHGWENTKVLLIASFFPPFEFWMVAVGELWLALLPVTVFLSIAAASGTRPILSGPAQRAA